MGRAFFMNVCHKCTSRYVCIYIYKFIYLYRYTCVYLCIYVYIYIHNHAESGLSNGQRLGCQIFSGIQQQLLQLTCAAELSLHHCVQAAVRGTFADKTDQHLEDCLILLQAGMAFFSYMLLLGVLDPFLEKCSFAVWGSQGRQARLGNTRGGPEGAGNSVRAEYLWHFCARGARVCC